MNPVRWAAWQISSYHPGSWCVFIIIAGVAAYRWRIRGIILGHIVIAAVVVWLDNRWIETVMNAPGWNGSPDRDLIFSFGVTLRILLINTVLLPVSLAGFLFVSRNRITAIFLTPLPPITTRGEE